MLNDFIEIYFEYKTKWQQSRYDIYDSLIYAVALYCIEPIIYIT